MTIPSGSSFHFDLNLFDLNGASVICLARTFAELAQDGLGPGRAKLSLLRVSQLDENAQETSVFFASGQMVTERPVAPMKFSLTALTDEVSRVRVRFVTPTELKQAGDVAEQPEFDLLAARLRDRIGTLSESYGSGALPIDFRAFKAHAAQVRMVACNIERVSYLRRSSRTGQIHPLGGFVGEAEYHGELGEFLPYLELAKWTGVGRQTVWGHGTLETTRLD